MTSSLVIVYGGSCTLGGAVAAAARPDLSLGPRSCLKTTRLFHTRRSGHGGPETSVRGLRAVGTSRKDRGFKAARDVAKTSASASATEPITLGTAEIPDDCDLKQLEALMYKWATNLSTNANVPMDYPLKVDRLANGLSLGFITRNDLGLTEEFVKIVLTVSPPSNEYPNAMFRAIRDGPKKDMVPPGEPALMQSMLVALKMSVSLSRPGK